MFLLLFVGSTGKRALISRTARGNRALPQYFHSVLFIHARDLREIVKGVIVIERHCCCVPFDRENYEGCSEINERVYISRN